MFAWIAVIAGVIVGARSFLDGGIPPVGEFLTFPSSPRELLDTFMSGWNPNGAGATSPNPTGWATLSGMSVMTLFHMGMLQIVFVLGLILVGVAGVWNPVTKKAEWQVTTSGGAAGVWNPATKKAEWQVTTSDGVAGVWSGLYGQHGQPEARGSVAGGSGDRCH